MLLHCSPLEDEDVIQVDARLHPRRSILDILFIMVWKLAGLLVRPKNMTKGLNSPRLCGMRPFHSSPSFTRTLLFPPDIQFW